MNEEKKENDYKVAIRCEVVQTYEEFEREMRLEEIKNSLKEDVKRLGMNRVKDFLRRTDKELCLLVEEMWKELDNIDRIGGNR